MLAMGKKVYIGFYYFLNYFKKKKKKKIPRGELTPPISQYTIHLIRYIGKLYILYMNGMYTLASIIGMRAV